MERLIDTARIQVFFRTCVVTYQMDQTSTKKRLARVPSKRIFHFSVADFGVLNGI